MIVQIRDVIGKSYTAGTKAVEDVYAILSKSEATTIPIARWLPRQFIRLGVVGRIPAVIGRIICRYHNRKVYRSVFSSIPDGSCLFIQHPIRSDRSFMKDANGFAMILRLKVEKHVKIITLIHDIDELRPSWVKTNQNGAVDIEKIIEMSDVMIAHNERMKSWLVNHGAVSERVVELGLFDYLTDSQNRIDGVLTDVYYAGSLSFPERLFLSHLKELPQINWHLFGPGYNETACKSANVHYHGMLPSDELFGHLNHGFGLVWDGESIEEWSGPAGTYLVNVNPHKLSLFMAAGIPAIAWSKSYSADFIKKHDVGIIVDSLKELPKVIGNMSSERYCELQRHVLEFSGKVRDGFFLKSALRTALDVLESAK